MRCAAENRCVNAQKGEYMFFKNGCIQLLILMIFISSGTKTVSAYQPENTLADRNFVADTSVTTYTYAKKNLEACDDFKERMQEINQQIDDAQNWYQAFKTLNAADYTVYMESGRFLILLATEGLQKATEIASYGILPEIQEIKTQPKKPKGK